MVGGWAGLRALGDGGGQRWAQDGSFVLRGSPLFHPHWPCLAKLTAGRIPSAIRQGDRVGPFKEGSREI